MRLIFAILCCFALAPAWAADPITPDFSGYPQTLAVRTYVASHTNAAWHAGRIFAMTEFIDGGRIGRKYEVNGAGQQADEQCSVPIPQTFGYTIHAPLPEAQLKALHSAISELPPTNAMPPINDLLIVSFLQGTNWITRTYDRRSLSKAMEQIFQIRTNLYLGKFMVQ
jgi:hypothetical protein